MALLPTTMLPQTEPLGTANGAPVTLSKNWYLLLYNLVLHALPSPGASATPGAAQSVTVSSSPFKYTAGQAGSLLLQGGFVEKVTLTRGSNAYTVGLSAAQLLRLSATDVVTITYGSVKPTATFFPA